MLAGFSLCAVLPVATAAEWKAYSTPGGQAPQPLMLHDLQGKQWDLSSMKGQVVLLNFWATWCEPCKAEMPAMNRLHKKFARQGFQVVGVNFGEGRARIEQFLRSTPVDFPILRDDDSAVSKAWRVRVLPVSFLIDRNGMLRHQLTGEADWDHPSLQAPILDLLK